MDRLRRAIVVAACAAAGAGLVACGSGSTGPTPPAECSIKVFYSGPPADAPPWSTDPMCPHHYAPVNLTLKTDWGASIRLKAADDAGHYAGELALVPTGADHWLVLYDIQWCGVGPEGTPLARSGVTLNSVPLTRLTTDPQGATALAFRVDNGCVVRP